MKRVVYPLYASADESRVKPILDALAEKGVSVHWDNPRKGDALVLFLSKNLTEDSPEEDAFFRLNAGRELVIPVNLDGCTPPEELQNALMARHALDGAKYNAKELAARIARAARDDKKSRLPLVLSLLSAAAMLVVGGLILWKQRPREEPTPEPPAVEAAAAPTPTAVPTPLPMPQTPFNSIDPADVVEVVYVGNEGRFYTLETVSPDDEMRGLDDVAYSAWADGETRFYSKEDGHEFAFAAVDLSWLPYLANLRYLTLCNVSARLPDLSGLPQLKEVLFLYSDIADLEGLRGSGLAALSYHGTSVTDFSPLSDCPNLDTVWLNLLTTTEADFSRFSPPGLKYFSFGNGNSLSALDLSGLKNCPKLEEVELDYLPLNDLSFLSEAAGVTRLRLSGARSLQNLAGLGSMSRLRELKLMNLPALRDLSGLEDQTSLEELFIENCSGLRDISALSGCRQLWNLRLDGDAMEGLRDVSVLGTLPRLNNIHLWAANLRDLDFLQELPIKSNLCLSCGLDGIDCSGLAAIRSFGNLSITCFNRSFSTVAPYLAGTIVQDLALFGAADLELKDLPRVTQSLSLSNCGIRDLAGMEKQPFIELRIENCPNLSSLNGFEALSGMGRQGSTLRVINCPRLTDWSAIEQPSIERIKMRTTFSRLDLQQVPTLPDFTRLIVYELKLAHLAADVLPDLSCLDGIVDGISYSFRFEGLDQITDLSPLFRLKGDCIEVPPQLAEQARELVDSGRFKQYEIVYPDGSWTPDDSEMTLASLDELDKLPKSILKRVRSLALAGDVLVNLETTDVREEWDEECPVVVLTNRNTGEETRVTQMGTVFTDLTRLNRLTGLENLSLFFEPVTDLEGIQALESLKNLEVKYSPAFTDASAAFTVQSLERVALSHTGLASLQGIQNLPVLRELYIDGTKVTDFSPLEGRGEELYFVFDMPELMTLSELKAMPSLVLERIDSIAVAGDYAYRQWDPWWIGDDRQEDGTAAAALFRNGSDEKLPVGMGSVTDLAQLSFLPNLRELKLYRQPIADLSGAAALTKLEGLDLGWCDELTDVSPLFALPELRDLNLNGTNVASIEGIEQLPHLASLAIAYCPVTDMSPLEKVDYSFCMQEENGGGFSLEAVKPREDGSATAADYGPLSAIPAFNQLDVSWTGPELWMEAVRNASIRRLNAQCGGLTANEALQAFVAAHPELEEIQLAFNDGITDMSCLLSLKRLRYVEVNAAMAQAIASLGDEYGFELSIRND